jgi:hypothetical protein
MRVRRKNVVSIFIDRFNMLAASGISAGMSIKCR